MCTANQCLERTAGKRCLPARFGLRPSPAAHAQRLASITEGITIDAELLKLIKEVLENGLTAHVWVSILAGSIGAGVGAYFGAYLKKVGEQRFLDERFDHVLKQLEAQTTVTEKIKSQFSGDLETLKHDLSLLSDQSKRYQELKAKAYVDFHKAAAGIGIAQKWAQKDKELDATILMTDAKARIAVYGSSEVARAVGLFFKEYGALTSPEAMACYIAVIREMRIDSAGQENSVPDNVLSRLFFSDDLPAEGKLHFGVTEVAAQQAHAAGHLVQKAVGERRTSLLPRDYGVECGLGPSPYPIHLTKATRDTQPALDAGPTCSRPIPQLPPE